MRAVRTRKCQDTRKKRVEGTSYTISGSFALATCKLRVAKFKILVFYRVRKKTKPDVYQSENQVLERVPRFPWVGEDQ